MRIALAVLIALGLLLAPAVTPFAKAADEKSEKKKEDKKKKKDSDGGGERPVEMKDLNREVSRIIRELQFALEGGSARSVLELVDSAKFDDYPRFEDMVERLTREDSIRAFFRQVHTAPSLAEGKAQTILDAEMELSRKDGAGQLTRRRQQLVLDFEHSRRGWRIVNITPRDYFQPL